MSDVDISQAHNELRLLATLTHLNLGPASARLRVYGTTRPTTPGGAPGGPHLFEFILNDPPGTVSNNQLSVTAVDTALVLNSGAPQWARIVNGDGDWSIDADAGALGSGKPVIVSAPTVLEGGEVALLSAIFG